MSEVQTHFSAAVFYPSSLVVPSSFAVVGFLLSFPPMAVRTRPYDHEVLRVVGTEMVLDTSGERKLTVFHRYANGSS